MRCSNCGKETPFAGNVCHLCGADKSKDQTRTSLSGKTMATTASLTENSRQGINFQILP
jgi:predicted amidophosphoribosyltransferase